MSGVTQESPELPRNFKPKSRNLTLPSKTPPRRAHNEGRVFFHGTDLLNPNLQIHADCQFRLGGCTAEIILTTGHTLTNLSVWMPEDRVLFTGDCLINACLPNLDAGTTADWSTWLESLQRIEGLQPSIIVAGHGPVARGDEVRVVIDTVRQVLEESIARGYSPANTRMKPF